MWEFSVTQEVVSTAHTHTHTHTHTSWDMPGCPHVKYQKWNSGHIPQHAETTIPKGDTIPRHTYERTQRAHDTTKHKRHKHTPAYAHTHAHDLASPWGMNTPGIISERERQGERKRDRKRKEVRMGEGI